MRKILFLLFIPVSYCSAQQGIDSVAVPASPVFKISGSRIFWMGKNYRTEWKMPVKAPVINLATEKGGLTPIKKGGGKQTRSLRLEDADGREYTLRSVRKYVTDEALPPDLRGTFAKDLVADGVSASYPYATLSIPLLSNAAGVPHGNPKVVFIPDDPKLGEYKNDFANSLAFFEERLPDSVKKGYDTDEVVEKLKDDNDNDVDQPAMLRARLLDMFIMDLDRHELQWNWGAYENEKGKTFYPIPKDRDQAFYISEGLIPSIARLPWIAPQVQGFRAKAININRFNFAARNLDRFFLNELNEQDWQIAADKFLSQMTDDVIEKSLNAQPKEIQSMSTGKIIQTLKDRRKYFAGEIMQYYRFLSEFVDITTSDKKEFFDITRNADGSVLVQVYKITNEGVQSRKMYERKFEPAVTKEICLYGFGGDDKFTIHGEGDRIKIRMIGGSGKDVFENTASSARGDNIIYDLKKENNQVTGGDFRNKISRDTAINSYDRLYYKYNQVIPFVSVNYNADDGLFLGASLKIIRQGFRKTPYKTMHQFAVNHSLATNAYNFRWYSEFTGALGKNSDLIFDADIKAPNNTINFFGYGDTTSFDKTKPGKYRYYRARFQVGDISMLIRKKFSSSVSVTFGPTFEFYSLDSAQNKNRFILKTGSNGLDPVSLFSDQSYIGGKLTLGIDTRNSKVLSTKGINWQTTVRALSGLNDISKNITQLNSDLSIYIPLSRIGGSSLVLRFGGGHNFKGFEFYQAQYLGGTENLRGYRKYRFAGQSIAYNNVELRIKLSDFRTYLFPGSLGLLAFHDAGRVWVKNDTSDEWHTGYGGGFWISPLKRLVITASYTISKEDKLPLITLGWQF
jgi:Omp85 superfamily domain